MDKSMEEAIRFISFELQDSPAPILQSLLKSQSTVDLTPMQTEFLVKNLY
jgi:hypothetical protein